MVAQHFKFRLRTGDVDEHQIVYIIADQDAVIWIGVIVVAIIGHFDVLN